MKKRLRYLFPLISLVLGVLACSLPLDVNPSLEKTLETAVVDDIVLPIAEEAPLQERQEEPPEAEAFLCPSNWVPGVFSEIQLCYPPDLMRAVSPSIYDENPPAEDEIWMFVVHPKMLHVSLLDYVLARPAFIQVYPIAAYIAMDPWVDVLITELEGLLASQDSSPSQIKFVPYQNASQLIVAKVNYLNFRNGRGVRFITQDAQDTLPINNQEAYYAFLGLTDDGQYLVSAVLPISSPLFFPDLVSLTDADWDVLWSGYEDYITKLKADLAREPLDSFMPSLITLDAIMSSILVPSGTLD